MPSFLQILLFKIFDSHQIKRGIYTKCWWCGKDADSREHKYKKTELKQNFGPGPYVGDDAVVRVVDGKEIPIQGPNSKSVKFSNSLCQKCNNVRSQPFDEAYTTFTNYLQKHETEITTPKSFEWYSIFGVKWKAQMLNVTRYYVKHICCRLVDSGIMIHPALIKFLNKKRMLFTLKLEMEIREDIVELQKFLQEDELGDGSSWIGEMMCMESKSTGILFDVISFVGFRWLRLNYCYDLKYCPGLTNFEMDIVLLPFGRNLTTEDFARIKDKKNEKE